MSSPVEFPYDWLVELHRKLWGKTVLLDQIIRTVTLDESDFIQLQIELQSLNPSRGSDSYAPTDVQCAKSAFLRSRNDLIVEAPADSEATFLSDDLTSLSTSAKSEQSI